MTQSNLSQMNQNDFSHISVLKNEAIEALKIKPGGKYIDATIGGGGHTKEIIERGGIVLGIDQDEDAISFVQKKFFGEKNLTLALGNFSDIKGLAARFGFEKVDGILFDLGLSSYQIDQSGRGFSFKKDEILDMRMNKKSDLSALSIVNNWTKDELSTLFAKYGEDRNAVKIAEVIDAARKIKPIERTTELASLIEENVRREGKIHPATKVFMALRIAVNNELSNLKEALTDSVSLLSEKGILCVISFHSLEDRIVKNTMRESGYVFLKKPVVASDSEIYENPRSRSAKMRILEKIKA